jgi:hypothetical protein
MHADHNHPGLKKFREIKAKEKEIAILRKEILENNPMYSEKQAQEIAQAAYRAKNASQRTIQVKGRNRKGRHNKGLSGPYHKTLSVKVEIINK